VQDLSGFFLHDLWILSAFYFRFQVFYFCPELILLFAKSFYFPRRHGNGVGAKSEDRTDGPKD